MTAVKTVNLITKYTHDVCSAWARIFSTYRKINTPASENYVNCITVVGTYGQRGKDGSYNPIAFSGHGWSSIKTTHVYRTMVSDNAGAIAED